MPVHPTSYPGHTILSLRGKDGNMCHWPMYTDDQGNQRYYKVNRVPVVRTSYEAAWNYIASRNNTGMNKRARKGSSL